MVFSTLCTAFTRCRCNRSWYNRSGVTRVMGFASAVEVEQFFNDVPEFERILALSDIKLIKY